MKANIFKFLKIASYFVGFPLMILLILISMMPMFNEQVMGDFARNWLLILLGVWAVFEIVRQILKRKLNKSEAHKSLATAITAIVALLCVMLPVAISDGTNKSRYESVQQEAAKVGANLKDYDYIMGWHNDFTNKNSDMIRSFLSSSKKFMDTYDVSSLESSWYGNADKENNLGYKIGIYDKIDELVIAKEAAAKKLVVAKSELAKIEGKIAEKQTEYSNAKKAYDDAVLAGAANVEELKSAMDLAEKALNDTLSAYEADLVRLKGTRVVLTPEAKQALNVLLNEVLTNGLPDGLKITIAGTEIDVKSLLDTIGKDTIIGMVNGFIPDVIYTGMGSETVKTLEGLVNGTDKDMSLAQVYQYAYELQEYPSLLATGHVKYYSYLFVGIILLSVLAVDYFSNKEKEAKGGKNE